MGSDVVDRKTVIDVMAHEIRDAYWQAGYSAGLVEAHRDVAQYLDELQLWLDQAARLRSALAAMVGDDWAAASFTLDDEDDWFEAGKRDARSAADVQ